MKNYLVYPTKVLRLTQNYNEGNHYNHSHGTPVDYPIDEACADAGRDWFYCPCDKIKIVKIYGVGTSGVNTIWMTSVNKVVMPCGEDYVTIMVEHPEDDDLKKLKVGQVFSRGEKMFREGGNGAKGAGTYGNHFHMSVGTGYIKGTGWESNSKGAWVLSVTGKVLKPEQAFYLDGTTVKNSDGLTFKKKPKETTPTTNDNKKEDKPVVFKKDNIPDAYAKEAIDWAIKNKILVGGTDGNLCLHSNITRQDMLVFLYRSKNIK